ncbi:hypothetical protein [Pallidibacillus pasinlerensis]|uniref:Uncharacterized protein n=1 Tax=Pallidibacillus pasinlerensis TaxID=2703818 RepID=A0ABX0A3I7_9BACI|nr:hypothetical protein [Pallidibacillus pasinlerensis]NCU18001.1 hypothetical protein [Pallidibacillus pasinlerensis]
MFRSDPEYFAVLRRNGGAGPVSQSDSKMISNLCLYILLVLRPKCSLDKKYYLL